MNNRRKLIMGIVSAVVFLMISALSARYASTGTAERISNLDNGTSSMENSVLLSDVKELQQEKIAAVNAAAAYASAEGNLTAATEAENMSKPDSTVKAVEVQIQQKPSASSNSNKSAAAAQKKSVPVESKGATSKKPVQVASRGSGTAASSKGISVVNTAKQYLGLPYAYGAAGPKAFDCSGLTMYVYSKFGISLPHSANAQSQMGRYVPKNELQPGDLVFFATSGTGRASHSGIYVGGGKFIHAPETGKTVAIESMSSSYYSKRYITARRFL